MVVGRYIYNICTQMGVFGYIIGVMCTRIWDLGYICLRPWGVVIDGCDGIATYGTH